MRNKLFLALIISVLGFAQLQSQTVVSLRPGPSTAKCAYVNSALSGAQGPNQSLVAAAWTYNGTSGVGRSFIDFDFSVIPANANILSAHLDLYWDPTGGHVGHSTQSGSNAAFIQRVTSTWNVATAVWGNQPSTTSTNQVSLASSTSNSQNYPNVDVTALVQDIVDNPGSSYGLMIKLQNETSFRSLRFGSSYHPDSTYRPRLVITYSDSLIDSTDCMTFKPGATGKDAYFNSATPSLQQGNFQSLVAAAWTYSGTPGIGRSLIEFDLGALPANATVTSARMGLFYDPTGSHVGHSSQSGSNEGRIRRVTSTWNENTVLWSNQPTFSNQNEVVIPQSSGTSDDYPNLDVTNLVLDILNNPSSSFGFIIMLANEQSFRSLRFASSDNPAPNVWPELEVCYELAIPATQPVQPAHQFSLLPNPSNGMVTAIVRSGKRQSFDIEVIDLNGRLLWERRNLSNSAEALQVDMDLTGISAGIYLVRIIGDHSVETQKLILER